MSDYLPKEKSMSGYLPKEILFNIFLQLPPKTLVLCSCVSRSWLSVITDLDFVNTHLNQSSTSNNKSLILRRSYGTGSKKKERYSLHCDSETLDRCQVLKFPFVNSNEDFKVVGICNGLVCLLGTNLFLWNPSIQKVVTVLKPSDFSCDNALNKFALGFGFDSRANDHKVVKLWFFEDKCRLALSRYPKAEVYDARTGSWREIDDKPPKYDINESQWTQAFVNGAVHWVAYREYRWGYKCFILRFDMVEECFSIMDLPTCLCTSEPWDYDLKVAVLGGALSIIQGSWYGSEAYVSSVWVLQKYGMPESWTHLVSFDRSPKPRMVLGLRENGDILLESSSGEVVLYKPENQLMKGLRIYGGKCSFYLDTYVESLALMDDSNGILRSLAEDDKFFFYWKQYQMSKKARAMRSRKAPLLG